MAEPHGFSFGRLWRRVRPPYNGGGARAVASRAGPAASGGGAPRPNSKLGELKSRSRVVCARAISGLASTIKVAGVAYAGALAMLYTFQRRVMYFPGEAAEVANASTMRARHGAAVEGIVDVFVPVKDGSGAVVHGYYLPPLPLARDRTTLVLFHGNAGHVAHRIWLCAALRTATGGCGVAIMDYRGYGRSDPRYAPAEVARASLESAGKKSFSSNAASPSESGIHADADAFVDHIAELGRLNVGRDIFLVGESLGTAVSVSMASRRNVRGLVLFSAFTSITDVAVMAYGSLVPGPLLRLLVKDRFDSLGLAMNSNNRTNTRTSKPIGPLAHTPLLMFHGDYDDIVPMELGLELYRAWPCLNKAFVTVKGRGHNDLYDKGDEVFRSVRNFVQSNQ
ncbi:hypothetical protein PPROV_000635700 [Pycnococcus provasolii]|uniref:Serine aminopeptidase S33 domain-containing protein n=3 Tax=Pycnococcus provasolii TaxID=41880 RepID=A0A830HLX0_9CHLO|nr:hypothetical protein PPROV_000635700 [Pycnococcus provasolii]